jgi:hypothetical protein
MKKILLLVSAWFLGCSDLSSDGEETLKNELPKDFKLSVYAEINADVVTSQVILDIQEQVKALYPQLETDSERKRGCGNILLEAPSFVEKIYTEYMKCPVKGWDPNKPCSGEYASNPNYTKADGRCVIGACWHGGWDQSMDYDWAGEGFDSELEYCIQVGCPPLAKDVLWEPTGEYDNAIDRYMNKGQFTVASSLDTLVGVICKYVAPNAENAGKAESYLENYPLDSTLIEKHYFLIGRNEGRPYKYCAKGETVERTVELTLDLTKPQAGSYGDYSKYLFCFDKSDYKVYVTQEEK